MQLIFIRVLKCSNNMQVKLTKVARSTTKKDGSALLTKDGRPYTRLSIKTQQHGDKWLSGFDNPQTKSWEEGQEVEIEVTENGEYLNFSVPKREDKVDQKLEQILNKLTGIGIAIEIIKGRLEGKTSTYPTPEDEDIDLDASPF